MRCDLPEHYLSEEHQRITLVIVLRMMTTMMKDTSQLTPCTPDTDKLSVERAVTTTSTAMVSDKTNEDMNTIQQTLDILNDSMHALRTELGHISDQSLKQSKLVTTTNQCLASLKLSIEESNVDLGGQKTLFGIFHQSILSMKHEAEDKQYISYDGTFIWKITDVAKKMGNEIFEIR